MLSENPIMFLAGKAWKYSAGNRRAVVFYAALSTTANLLILAEPLVVARIFNMIQEEGIGWENLPRIFALLAVLVGIAVMFWATHGPARVIEDQAPFAPAQTTRNICWTA